MATVGTFNVALVASTSRFIAGISKADRTWNNFARNVQRQAKQMPKAIQEATSASLALARNVSKLAAVAGAAFSGMGVWGVRLEAQFEQTRTAMTTMLGSAEEADRFLRQLEKQARRTPFGFQQLVEMSRQMLAWGFARQEIERMIGPIGDFVAAMGGSQETIDRIIRALGQMRSRAKVSAEEMLQLTEAGVPAWEMLAKAMGTSIPEAMEQVRKGTVSAAVGIQAIIQGLATDPRFAGAMERQARTMLGQWEQLKDGLATITRGFGADIIRIFGLADALRNLNEVVGRFADAVSDKGFIGALREAFPPWVQAVIIGIAGAIGGALVPVIVSWLIPALKKLAVSLWATLRPLLPWMAIGAALALVAWALARNWQAAWAYISAVTLYAASIVVRGVGMIVSAIALIVPGLRGAAQAIRSWADSLRDAAAGQLAVARSAGSAITAAKGGEQIAQSAQQAAEAQQDLGKATEEAAKAAQSNLQSFDEVHTIQEAMADSPAALDVPILDLAMPEVPAGGLGGAIGELAQQVEETTGRLAQAWQKAVQNISDWWDRLKQKALETFPWLRDVADGFAKVADWVRDNWSTVGPIIEGVAGVLALLGIAFLIATSPIAALVAGALLVAGVAALIIANWDTVGPFLIGLWEAISPALISIWEVLKTSAITIWNTLVATAKVIWDGLKAWWSVWGDNVLVILGAVWNQIVLTVQTATNLVKHLIGLILAVIQGDWAAAWDHVKGIAVTVWNFLVGTAQNLWMTLQTIWQGIVEGIQIAWQWLQSLTMAIWTALVEWLKGIWQGILTAASTIWQAIHTTIATWWENIRAGTRAVWTALTEWLGNLWTAISDTVAATWEEIWATIGSWWDTIRATSVDVWQAISAFLTTIWNGIKGTANAVWSWITDRITGLAATVRDSVIAAWNWAANALANIWNGIKNTAQSVWDGIGQIIRGAINWIIGIVNKFIDFWNSIKITVPSVEIPLVGKVGGFTIGVPQIPRIPMLARGGIVEQPTLALIGEAGKEAVVPLEHDNVLAESIGQSVYKAMVTALRLMQASGAQPGGEGQREIVLRIDGTTFARAVMPYIIREGQRRGLNLRPQTGV